jgi:hypothetical protein
MRAAPVVSCAICAKENAHEHTGPAEAIRLSLRDGFTVSFVLSPVTGLLPPSSLRSLLLAKLSASTGAPGPHDLMSSRFFGLLKTSEVPENKGFFDFCSTRERPAETRRAPIVPVAVTCWRARRGDDAMT